VGHSAIMSARLS